MNRKGLTINQSGHLMIGGCDAVELCRRFGTPLYVMIKQVIDDSCAAFTNAFNKHYNSNGRALYASKAFCCKEMSRLVVSNGLGLDVSSTGEIYTALSAGVDAKLLYYHGNNKTYDDIEYAIKSGVGRIIADNEHELTLIDEISQKLGVVTRISFRVKPGVDAHTHDFIRTGQIDSKFGVALETGEAMDFAKKATSFKNIELVGLHCHIGSQIFDKHPFYEAAKIMVDFMGDLKDKLGIEITELDLGGGFGIKYTNSDDPVPVEEYISQACESVRQHCERRSLKLPYLLVEPGRSIAGPAGITLYTVGTVKSIPGIRDYLLIDGGMNDNPRYALYGAKYSFEAANRMNEPKDCVYTVAGRACESGDLLGENVPLQKCQSGDILAVLDTGAYNYSMASCYNRFARPACVLVDGDEARVIIKRESLDDIIKNDI